MLPIVKHLLFPVIVSLLLIFPHSLEAKYATLSVDQIKAGQKGYGLTVFSGFKIERFSVEVIAVLKNFLPKQDIILMRGDHPVLRKAGVLGGMSGSPIFIEGKLVGALAYGWRFSKEPVFGVTPIADMKKLLKRKTKGRKRSLDFIAMNAQEKKEHVAKLMAALDRRTNPLHRLKRAPQRSSQETMLRKVSVPLSVSGVRSELMGDIKEQFAKFGLNPLQGGGSGKAEGPKRFEMGGAIGVQMVRGDISMTGTGTVTYVDGSKVLGFGHPMFNAGEIYLPTVSARIQHPIASVSRSFKLSTPARQIGALVHDRQPGIMADMKGKAPMIPVKLTIKSKESQAVYTVELARHRFLAPNAIQIVVTNAVKEAMPDIASASFTMKTRYAIKGYPALMITDQSYSSGGLASGLFFAKGTRALRLLANNPFEDLQIERIDVEINTDYGNKPLQLVRLNATKNVASPGEKIALIAVYKPVGGGKTIYRRYPFAIPKSMTNGIIQVELAGGQHIKPEFATPESTEQYLRAIAKGYAAKAAVLSLSLPSKGLKISGRVLEDLPESAFDSLTPGSSSIKTTKIKTIKRQSFSEDKIIIGKKKIRLRINNEVIP